MTIKMISETEAQVTKAFQKKAMMFGTDEYYFWRKCLAENPGIKMTTKSIKKNSDKKNTRNKTYEKMAGYLATLSDGEKLLSQFEIVKQRSQAQAHPYGYVLKWYFMHVSEEDFNTFVEASASASH